MASKQLESIQEFKARKWETLFKFLDARKDGILHKDELMMFPIALAQSGQQENGESLVDLHNEYWRRMNEVLGKDPKNDSFVVQEWIDGCSIMNQTSWCREELVPACAHVYFEAVDLNHDGWITMEEWRKYQHIRGMSDESVIKYTFQKLDKDGNGKINPEEIRDAVLQFSLGEDPSDDYSFLYATEASS